MAVAASFHLLPAIAAPALIHTGRLRGVRRLPHRTGIFLPRCTYLYLHF